MSVLPAPASRCRTTHVVDMLPTRRHTWRMISAVETSTAPEDEDEDERVYTSSPSCSTTSRPASSTPGTAARALAARGVTSSDPSTGSRDPAAALLPGCHRRQRMRRSRSRRDDQGLRGTPSAPRVRVRRGLLQPNAELSALLILAVTLNRAGSIGLSGPPTKTGSDARRRGAQKAPADGQPEPLRRTGSRRAAARPTRAGAGQDAP
jgi:hypothetical protein